LKERFDIAVVGSGFAGSLMAMIAKQLGLRVILLERGRHPRVVIGESSTPLSNLLLEELADHYNLPHIRSLSKWGSWQQHHPELACGLKRGFSFFHHHTGCAGPVDREHQLLVAASPHDAIADTHWYRADFDAYLVSEAQGMGVTYLDEVELQQFIEEEGEAVLTGKRRGHEIGIRASFVVDATGPRGFLHRTLGLGEHSLPGMPSTEALYSYFTGVKGIEETGGVMLEGEPPYRPDDAAVHHVIGGGWVWVLKFSNAVTSAGIAAASALATQLRLSQCESGWERLLDSIPVLREQFRDAKPLQPFRHISKLSFRSASITGRRWALLPSAAGFIDPLLSTGFPLTLLGVTRIADILEKHWGTEEFGRELHGYAVRTDAELLATSRLIGALYANFGNFPVFSAISLLYFAAASYSEAARRLGKPQLAASFLLHDHPVFGPASAHVLEQALTAGDETNSKAVIEAIYRVIEPIDVAGLRNQARRNWYPADAKDLYDAAHKLGASRWEIAQMLERCGFNAAISLPM